MWGRSVARSRGSIVGRGGGRGNNRSGRGSDSNGDGGNGSGSNYANMRDDVVEAATDGFDSAQPDVSNDPEISNVAPMSNFIESHALNSTSKKLVNITPDQECFDDDGSANRAVTEIIKNMYRGAWPTWTSIPTVHKCQMFDQFKKDFRWDSECEGSMSEVFYKVCGKMLREMLRIARNKASRKATDEQDGNGNIDLSSYNPAWINQDIWLSLVSHWNKDEWKKLSTVNKANTEK